MTVYIEYAILDNLVIDYLLLKYTYAILKVQTKLSWLFLCAVISTVFALLLPLINVNAAVSATIKLVFSLLLVYASAFHKSIKKFLLSFLVFLLYTFLLGGGITGIFNLFGIPYETDLSFGIIISSAYALIKIINGAIKYIYRRRNVVAFTFDCLLILNKKQVKTNGFFDTGNLMYDDESKDPVCIISKEVAIKLMGDFSSRTKGKYVETATIGRREKILCFKIDELVIFNGDKQNIFNNVTVGISNARLNKDVGIILHSEYMGGCYDSVDRKTEKTA